MNTLPFDNSYSKLPDRFFSRQQPEPVSTPGLIRVNHELAAQLGLDASWLESDEGINALAGNSPLAGSDAIATVYAGHQFGSWNPQLGDGRAVLLGEIVGEDGERYDLQLKGSGPTPYSRGGDGRAPLGPVLREYVVSEAMAVLGVPTTRALAAVTTGESVYRDTALPGAVLTRVAHSHIRIGTFQFFAAREDTEAVQILADHVIQRHFPEVILSERPVLGLLRAVIERQARLIAQWQCLGFIHGVMNTDNMLLCGETVDYGPCAFMDVYNPETVFSSIDHKGRYAYRNQPGITHWNLANLAQALLPLLDEDQDTAVTLAQEAVDTFPECFLSAYQEGVNRKLGLTQVREGDDELAQELMQHLASEKLDFTLAFRRLADLACADNEERENVSELFHFPPSLTPWLERWEQRIAQDSASADERQKMMDRANPAFIPRNHQLEAVIDAATNRQDLGPFHQLVDILSEPHQYRSEHATYALPPQPGQEVQQTFCGT